MVAMYKYVVKLVGIDLTRNKLTKKLLDEDKTSNEEQLKTISIVGIGWLGKTTLTKAVYDKIKAWFDFVPSVPLVKIPI